MKFHLKTAATMKKHLILLLCGAMLLPVAATAKTVTISTPIVSVEYDDGFTDTYGWFHPYGSYCKHCHHKHAKHLKKARKAHKKAIKKYKKEMKKARKAREKAHRHHHHH